MFLVFCSVLILLYSAMVFTFIVIWNREPVFFPKREPSSTFISIVIAARNEAATITRLLNCLEGQTYPVSMFEVLVVDDCSVDKTHHVVRDYQKLSKLNIRLIKVEKFEKLFGKKAAIQTGITFANGPLIVTTDADCVVKPEWLSITESFLREKDLKMVVGPVAINQSEKFFSKMQVIEFASLVGSGACILKSGIPSMCNGANLAYYKDIFLEVKGFEGNEEVASGDDEFLMHKIYQKYPGKVKFLKNPGAVVSTDALSSYKKFYQQRKRWASKWGHYKNSYTKYIALFIFISNFATVLFYSNGLIILERNPLIFLPLAIKVIVELLFLKQIVKFFSKKFNVPAFLLLELIYPFYVCFFGIISSGGKYKWKGRTLK